MDTGVPRESWHNPVYRTSSSEVIWVSNTSILKHYAISLLSKPVVTHKCVLLARYNKLASPAPPSLLLFHSPYALRKKLSNLGEVGY